MVSGCGYMEKRDSPHFDAMGRIRLDCKSGCLDVTLSNSEAKTETRLIVYQHLSDPNRQMADVLRHGILFQSSVHSQISAILESEIQSVSRRDKFDG